MGISRRTISRLVFLGLFDLGVILVTRVDGGMISFL